MIVYLRQLVSQLRNGLSTVPLVFAFVAVLVAFGVLRIDAVLGDDYFPLFLRTSADNSRAVLSTIAGGLISAVTLLLSLALVAIQLGSSQFSPRTLTNWLGDRVLQIAIGLAVGTVIYCLVVLQTLDNFASAESFASPHRAVLLALLLGLASIVGVVRSVDHLAQSLRVGSVAQTILAETLALIESQDDGQDLPSSRSSLSVAEPAIQNPGPRPDEAKEAGESNAKASDRMLTVESKRAGWIQQIDREVLLRHCPEFEEVKVLVTVGSFSFDDSPLVTVSGDRSDDESSALAEQLRNAFAIGDTRTMQQDISFGFLRLTDIAMRALSPGINDPNTAIDTMNHICTLLLRVFAQRPDDGVRTEDNRTVSLPLPTHGDYVDQTFDPIRHAAADSPLALAAICRLGTMVVAEIDRRDLPTSPSILAATADAVQEHLDASSSFTKVDRNSVQVELDCLQRAIGADRQT